MNERTEASKQEDDLDILHPDRQLLIDGHMVTVNELTFTQGLRSHKVIAPIVQDLQEVLLHVDNPEDASLDDLQGLFAEHSDAFLHLITLSTGLEPRFIDLLGDTDGQRLLLTFWQVNALFFVRRLLERIRRTKDQGMTSRQSAGERSTQH